MKWLHMVSEVLVFVGALNWGLVGLLNFNLVMVVLGQSPMLVNLVYDLVGLSALYLAFTHRSYCAYCSGKMKK